MAENDDPHDGGRAHSSLPRWLVVGFSGHRNLHGRDDAVAAAIGRKLDELSATFPRLAGICSVASGADTIFAEAMLARGGPLSVVLPFDARRFRADFDGTDGPAAWDQVVAVLSKVPAHRIDVVHQHEADAATDAAADAGRDLEAAYYEATVRTVDRADVLFVVWDGQPGTGRGGTADAVAYAKAIGRPVIHYDPFKDEVVRDLTADDRAALAGCAGGEAVAVASLRPRELVQREMDRFGQQAEHHRPSAHNLVQFCVVLHLVAATMAALAILSVLHGRWAAMPAALEIGVLAAVWVILVVRAEHHHRWFTARITAEICRTFLATWDVRRRPSVGHQPRPPIADHIEAAAADHHPSPLRRLVRRIHGLFPPAPAESVAPPEHLFRTLRFLRDLDATQVPPLDVVRDQYVADRMTTKPEAQIPYYTTKLAVARATYRRYTTAGAVASAAAAIAAAGVVLTLAVDPEREWIAHGFEFFGIVLPLAATAFTFLTVISDTTRRVHRYDQMLHILNKQLPKVKAAPTWDALARAVTIVEEELLQEVVEWQSFVHYTEHLH